MSTLQSMRLQKFLAAAGVASRRGSEAIIQSGRVSVNGEVVTVMGTTVDPAVDRVELDGQTLKPATSSRTIMLNKPRGYICSTNEEQGRTIYELVPRNERLVPVGRLDKQTEGLILLSGDGELVNKLTHPRYGHEKCYHVSVRGDITPRVLEALRKPMMIDGYRIRPCGVELLESRERETVLIFTLREGRNRQIREMCEQLNLQVIRLVRVSFATLQLGDLTQGEWRPLTESEMASLTQDHRSQR
jgi:23S rRNA pseudouridine2605 synthase